MDPQQEEILSILGPMASSDIGSVPGFILADGRYLSVSIPEGCSCTGPRLSHHEALRRWIPNPLPTAVGHLLRCGVVRVDPDFGCVQFFESITPEQFEAIGVFAAAFGLTEIVVDCQDGRFMTECSTDIGVEILRSYIHELRQSSTGEVPQND